MKIARALLDELIEHAREEAPNECCGLIATRDGTAVAVHRITNIHASPLRYEMHSEEQLAATMAIDEAGLEIGANYHSHTRSAPRPSQTDINLADRWPDPRLVYVIVGLDGDEPEVRAWRIVEGDVSEEPLDVTS